MDSESLKILISGISTTVGLIGGTVLKTYIENKSLFNLSKGRKKKLNGNWVGHFTQNKDSFSDFNIDLKVGRKKISGTGTIGFNKGKVSLYGGYRNDRFLKLDYQNIDNEIIQFGTIILELSPDNESLNGEFLGYGPKAKKIVAGNIEMKKLKNCL
jgi:hypothetical protein